jgi:hypothetical protein
MAVIDLDRLWHRMIILRPSSPTRPPTLRKEREGWAPVIRKFPDFRRKQPKSIPAVVKS